LSDKRSWVLGTNPAPVATGLSLVWYEALSVVSVGFWPFTRTVSVVVGVDPGLSNRRSVVPFARKVTVPLVADVEPTSVAFDESPSLQARATVIGSFAEQLGGFRQVIVSAPNIIDWLEVV
jgi:hypothetical protein